MTKDETCSGEEIVALLSSLFECRHPPTTHPDDPFRGYRVFPKWDRASLRLRCFRREVRFRLESAWDALRGQPDRHGEPWTW